MIAALFLSFAFAGGLSAQTNFAGGWKRNNDKTDPGDLLVNRVLVLITVRQDAQRICLRRLSENRRDDTFNYGETLTFDGTPSSYSAKPNLKKTATIKWSDDKTTFTEWADYVDSAGKQVKQIKEIWTLGDEGKTLTVSSKLTVDGQTYNMKEVFDKQ